MKLLWNRADDEPEQFKYRSLFAHLGERQMRSTHLNNSAAPSLTTILAFCRTLYRDGGEESVLKYLALVASNDYSCPDKCDEWAMRFLEENEEEIAV